MFAASIGQGDLSVDELICAARADGRFVEVRPEWFALELLTEAD